MRRFIFIFVLTLSLCGCRQAQLKRVRVAPEPVKVGVMTVDRESSSSQRNYIGTIQSSHELVLSSPAIGTVESVNVSLGEWVRSGQQLVAVDAPTVKSSYQAAQASRTQAQDAFERALKVYGNGSISEIKMVEIRTKLEQARAIAESASEAMNDCRVKAPFSGKISDVLVHKGDKLIVGQPLVRMIDMDSLEVQLMIPETEIAKIKNGMRANVVVPAANFETTATLYRKALVSEALNHSYKCSLRLSSLSSILMSGMMCRVYLSVDQVSGLSVPANAVQLDSDGKYVWIVRNGVALKRRIETGGFRGKKVLVVSGLESGDRVVTEGFSKVSGGMRVDAVER